MRVSYTTLTKESSGLLTSPKIQQADFACKITKNLSICNNIAVKKTSGIVIK